MQHNSAQQSKIVKERFRHFWVACLGAAALTLVGLLVGTQPVFATNSPSACDGTSADPDTCTGRTTGSGNVCIGDLSGFGTGINCTANDVAVGFADNIRNPSTGAQITSCVDGSTLNFTADFHVGTSGGATRYDLGLYFATDGDPNHDGAKTGGCAVSKISGPKAPPTPTTSSNWIPPHNRRTPAATSTFIINLKRSPSPSLPCARRVPFSLTRRPGNVRRLNPSPAHHTA